MTTDLDRLIEAVEAGEWDHASAASSASKWLMRKPGRYYGPAHSAFGGSLDAAVALLEALLPGAPFTVGRDSNSTFWAVVRQSDGTEVDINHDHSPARALLLATLRAYRSTGEDE